ncbi:hypothetical protein [Janibacter cremeus]|uniref:Integral membrane protein n=1 Tax=Janibacter cremeus TaxID=1285192 RepID=A0A852VUS6_9MICO|nr:hypothetical protein [Janibacter cremeus]NYF97545.1 hypothetical protein [Janibacter cremeus]
MSRVGELTLRVLVVAALAVDCVVHVQLADAMQLAAPGGIGGGTLFRAQAIAAGLAAVILLATGRRFAYILAAVVALSAFVPVLLYTYVAVPTLGPIPSMYDPTWSDKKLLSALAEGLAVLLATIGSIATRRRPVSPRSRPR